MKATVFTYENNGQCKVTILHQNKKLKIMAYSNYYTDPSVKNEKVTKTLSQERNEDHEQDYLRSSKPQQPMPPSLTTDNYTSEKNKTEKPKE